ncbi:hypothetical protein ACOMHN_011102 [Nucella lapillus]
MFCGTLKGSLLDKLVNRKDSEADDINANHAGNVKKIRSDVRRHLPVPKGPHTVGIVDIMCERGENGSFFRLYYPTAKVDIYKRDRQWPLWLPRKQYGLGYVHFLRRNTKLFGKLFNWIGGDVHVPALWQSIPLQTDGPFPLVIFSHGIGGNRTTYTTMCVELASQGFVVAALEHRDGSASMTVCLKNNHSSSVRVITDHTDHTDPHNIATAAAAAASVAAAAAASDSDITSAQPHHQPHHHNNNNNNSHNHPHPHDNHHHDFKEEWKWFEHVEKWDDFDYRNGQMYKRAEECRTVLNILTEMNAGTNVHNTLGLTFNTQHFKGRLDLSKVSLIGHSFGGSTCVATLALEPRFKVGVVLDGWMHPVDDSLPSQVTQPTLMVNMESFQWRKNIKQMMRMKEGAHVDRPMITIRGTCHQSVTDFQFLCNMVVGRMMEVRYKLDPVLCMDLSCKATLGFLWKHLATLGFLWKHLGMENKPHYEDILSGQHKLIIPGTNVDLS